MNLKLDVINNSDKDVQHILVHFIQVRIYLRAETKNLKTVKLSLEYLHCEEIILFSM